VAVIAHDRLARGARRYGGGRARRAARLAQRAAARLRVAAVTAGIPLNLVQEWLEHAQLSTTATYADAVSTEEQDIASRMWG